MPWRVFYNSTTDIVEIINEGIFTSEDLFAEVTAGYDLAMEKGTLKFLVDTTKREKLKASVFDFFKVPKMFSKMPELRKARIAVILPIGKNYDEGVRFFETVCLNRGYLVHTFKAREEAEEWLTQITN